MALHRPVFYAALLLAVPSAGFGAAEAAGLFSPDREAAPPRPATRDLRVEAPGFGGGLRREAPAAEGALPPLELRSRAAEVDLGRLEAARLDAERRRPHRLNLNLFADAEFDAVFERSAATASGYTLTGRLVDEPMSAVALAVNGDWVAGTVWSPHGRYAVRPLGGGVAEVRQLDPSALGRCGLGKESAEGPTGLPPPGVASAKSAPLSEAFPEDDGDLIDLLVVYPSFARRSMGGHLAMRALIDSDVAMANEAYRVGGAMQRLNLAAAVEARRTPMESRSEGMKYALGHLADPSSGYLDEVSGLRDNYAADLALVHWGDLVTSGLAGVANKLDSLSNPSDPDGLSVSTSSRAFVHELGHNMGIAHQRGDEDPKSNLPFPYSYGHVGEIDPPSGEFHIFGKFGTIMSTLGLAVPRFSNPRQHYPDESGELLGVPGDEPTQSNSGPADAVRSLNGTRRVVANFRRSASRCDYELSPPPKELPAAGGEFRIEVKAGAGCPWEAWSNDGFVSVLGGASGVGNGEVVVRVSANEGWEREAAVFVAGEAHLAEQATARARGETPVCDRTRVVREAIVAEVGKPCGEIGAEDLGSIRTLDFHPPDERRLGPGAFDGLTGLVSLDLSWKGLTNLDPGVFDGLVRLVSLDLRHNELRALEAGVLDGLPNLVSLDLEDNAQLADLKPGAFKGLANLLDLNLHGTGLTALKAGAFEGLESLHELEIQRAAVAKIESGAFRGLRSLYRLWLVDFQLTDLEPGVFDGLPNLLRLKVTGNLGTLRRGVFNGLPRLYYLILVDAGIADIELGAFDGLDALINLNLWNNELQSLSPGVFDGLDALQTLHLLRNELHALEPGVFDGLSQLWWLSLSDNKLTTLPPKLIHGLDSLRVLNLRGNQLRTVEAGFFDGQRDRQGHSRMFRLELSGNRLTTLDPDLLRGMSELKYLELADNRFTALPPGLFGSGLHGLLRLDLSGNPGTPFAFRPEFVPSPADASDPHRPAEVALELTQGAAFDLHVTLSASGGTLSAYETAVRVGETRSGSVAVRLGGAGPVTVHMTAVSNVPGGPCREMIYWADSTPCFRGVGTALGAPFILYGFPNQTLPPNGVVRFDLLSAFPDFPEGTTFTAELSDPTVADATVREGVLTIASTGGGTTTVSVAAQDADGRREVRSFRVTVEQAVSSYWSGWRSVLLQLPPPEEGGGS